MTPRASSRDRSPAPRHRDDGLAAKSRIQTAALKLFRDKGFDRTTMRDVARRARVSLGLAYHYFPSKEALVLAYYSARQREHAATVAPLLPAAATLAERVRIVLETKQRLLDGDRDLLVALTRVVLDPTSPLSAFAEETRTVREESVAIFRTAVDHPDVPASMRDLLATALWAAHMGTLIRFVNDDSEGHRETYRLIDAIVQVFPALVSLLGSPMLAPLEQSIRTRLESLGLVLLGDGVR
jgi:AcrR family transcriptional regulator